MPLTMCAAHPTLGAMSDSGDLLGDNSAEDKTQEPAPTAAELEAAGQSALFGGAASEPSAIAAPPLPLAQSPPVADAPAPAAQPYRVLARKYRPQTFSELIGQDAMVHTLGNAIERERLAHAFLMTGVRGVGKTSTARLIAKALNCIGPGGEGGPTIDPCGSCEPCIAIAEGRHIDVIEMDAASHTGVDDVREIIEAVRYAAVSARYKIYIIDEVHMLSRNAFNALLKTLEEPPAHVKFLFATTEADKLPVTVLSRCQRFDLRRIDASLLKTHFATICGKEKVEAEDEALAMIASAAEGSVRDGLSILDQAIAHADLDAAGEGGGVVTAGKVRDMLGLADRSAQRLLFSALMTGDGARLLDCVDAQYSLGVEPLALMRSQMELTNRITVAQIGRSGGDAATEEERAAIEEWADRLGAAQLHRLWQLLIKGYDEVRQAPDPMVAAQMALLRVMHAANMPDPGSLVKVLEDMASAAASAPPANPGAEPAGSDSAPSAVTPPDWPALIDRIDAAGYLRVAQLMRDWVRVIALEPGKLAFSLVPGLAIDPAPDMRDALLKTTGTRWELDQQAEGGVPSLREITALQMAEDEAAMRRDPLVEAAFAAFPQAEIIKEDEAPEGRERNWSKRA